MSTLKQKAVKGLLWSTVERFSAQGMQFLLGIIIARLLLPSDYGLIGMLAVFLAISETFMQSGFGAALIQKRNRDDLDFSTTFYFNIVVAAIFYLLLFFFAPFIANFYQQSILIPLIRVIGITIIINSFAVVQRTKYDIILDFKTQTIASLTAVIFSGIVGIYLAYSEYGVWALVWQTILRRVINVIILWYFSNWLPKKGFSVSRFRKLFSFGSKLLLSGLLNTVYKNIYLIVIGKEFTAGDLGNYTKAKEFNDFPSSNMTGILHRVTFPILSELQDDDSKLKVAYRKLIKLSALIIFPLMMGLAVVAEPLIILLLTDKWIETVWMVQLVAFSSMWYPVHALNLNILNVKGRSDLVLKLAIIKKATVTIILIISIPLGLKAMIIGQIFATYIALVLNTYYTKKIIGYGFFQQMRDLIKVLLLSISMGIVIYFTISFIQSNLIKLIVGIVEGLMFYTFFAWLLNIGEIRYLFSFLKKEWLLYKKN